MSVTLHGWQRAAIEKNIAKRGKPSEDPAVTKDLVVSNLGRAVSLLQACNDAEEAKRFIDIGQAARVYAERQRLGVEAQNSAVMFVVRAKRRLGEILTNAELHKGGRPAQKPVNSNRQVLKLAELGISRDLSSKAQQLASISENNFEWEVAYHTSRGRVSAKDLESKLVGIYVLKKPPKPDGPDYACPACGHAWKGQPKAGLAKGWEASASWAKERIDGVINRELERVGEQGAKEVIAALRRKVFKLAGIKRWRCGWRDCPAVWEGPSCNEPQDWSWPDSAELAALVNSGRAAEHTFNSFVVLCPKHAEQFADMLYG